MAFACGFALVFFTVLLLTLRPRETYLLSAQENVDTRELGLRYKPMMRLLDGSDFAIVSLANNSSLLGRFRAQRRRIFRAYLKNLRIDHAKICAQIKSQILGSGQDCPELTSALIKMEFLFDLMMFSVNLRLLFHWAGIGTVSVSGLMSSFEQLRLQAERLAVSNVLAAAASA